MELKEWVESFKRVATVEGGGRVLHMGWEDELETQVKNLLESQKHSFLTLIEGKRQVYDEDVDQRNDKYRFEGANKILADLSKEVQKL